MKKQLTALFTATIATTLGLSSAYAATSAPSTMPQNPDITAIHYTQSGHFQAGHTFHDVSSDSWAIRFITEMSTKGYISGYEDGKFRPSNTVTKEEAIIMTVRAMGLGDEAAKLGTSVNVNLADANDVSLWARPYVETAIQHGFVDANTTLGGHQKADREWVTQLVVRALGLQDEATAHMKDTLSFQDAATVSAQDVGYIAVGTEEGLLKGYPDNTFRPHQPVQRAEMAVILTSAEHLFDYDSTRETQTQGQLNGTIKSVTATSVTFTTPDGQDLTYSIASPSFVFLGEKMSSLSDLKAGMWVHVLLNAQGQVVFLQAKTQAPPTKDYYSHANGRVTSYTAPTSTTAGSITLALAVHSHLMTVDGTSMPRTLTLSVAPNVKINSNGSAKTAADVVTGNTVQLEIVNNVVQEIDVLPTDSTGQGLHPYAE